MASNDDGWFGPISPAGRAAIVGSHSIADSYGLPFTIPTFYGFGWFTSVYRREMIITHAGAIIGFSANVIFLPKRKWAVAVFSNAISSVQIIASWEVLDRYLETPAEEMFDSEKEYIFPPFWVEGLLSRLVHMTDSIFSIKAHEVYQKHLLELYPSNPLPSSAAHIAITEIYRHLPASGVWRYNLRSCFISRQASASSDRHTHKYPPRIYSESKACF